MGKPNWSYYLLVILQGLCIGAALDLRLKNPFNPLAQRFIHLLGSLCRYPVSSIELDHGNSGGEFACQCFMEPIDADRIPASTTEEDWLLDHIIIREYLYVEKITPSSGRELS